MKPARLMTILAILLIIAAGFAVYGIARPIPTVNSNATLPKTTTAAYRVTTYQVGTTTTRSASGAMNLLLDVSQGTGTNINVTLSESIALTVPLPWDCNSLTDDLGMCTGCYMAMYGNPARIAIYEGYYDQGNLTGASPVLVSDSTAGCYGGTVTWYYYPSGTISSFVGTGTRQYYTNISTSASVTFGSHWSYGLSTYTYAQGQYTILGVDVWGDVVVLHLIISD